MVTHPLFASSWITFALSPGAKVITVAGVGEGVALAAGEAPMFGIGVADVEALGETAADGKAVCVGAGVGVGVGVGVAVDAGVGLGVGVGKATATLTSGPRFVLVEPR